MNRCRWRPSTVPTVRIVHVGFLSLSDLMARILRVDVTLNVTCRSERGLSNVPLALAVPRRNVTLPGQARALPRRPQPSRSAFRGAGSVGDPGVASFLASPFGLRSSLSLRSLP
jgi:hypothetical protein